MENSIIGPESVKTQTDLGGQNQVTSASESEKTESLSIEESARLNELEEAIEGTIETGRAAIAQALKAIRDERLYRVNYASFETYVNERWGYSRSHAYRLINFAECIEMSPAGDTPKTEREFRATKTGVKAKAPSAILKVQRGVPVQPGKEIAKFRKLTERLTNWLAPVEVETCLRKMRDYLDAEIAKLESDKEVTT
jgi:hypothetical protein